MAKRLAAKVGTYQKDGQEKGEYARLGVILSNDNGEYLLLDPTVSIAGVLAKQNALAAASGGQQRDMVMVSVFDDSQQQGGQQQQGGGFNQGGGQQQGGGFNQGGGQQQGGGFNQQQNNNPQF